MGLTRSSIQFVEIRSSSRYKALGRTGRFSYSRKTGKLRMKSGPLRRRVAHFEPGRGAKIVFKLRENRRHGKPTIDVSDTTCYRSRR